MGRRGKVLEKRKCKAGIKMCICMIEFNEFEIYALRYLQREFEMDVLAS